MDVLITGCNSDVGVALSERLVASGHTVRAYDVDGSRRPGAIEFVEGDVRDFGLLATVAEGCDVGLHLAALSGDSPAADILSVNVLGAYGFLSAASKNAFRTSVVASSAPVHLDPRPSDDAPLLRTSADRDHTYDLSKTLQEVIGRDFHAHGLPVLCLRFGHIVLGEEEKTLDRSKDLSSEAYCRGGWVALEDIAVSCAAALAIEPSHDALEVLNVVGSVSARERFRVADAESRLGVELQYDFSDYE